MFKDTNNLTLSENIDNMVYDGIGFNGIRYIQESGQKVQGKIYLDKTQPGLWYCLKTNTSINNTSDFTRADSTALLDKLQNLSEKNIKLSDNNTGMGGKSIEDFLKTTRLLNANMGEGFINVITGVNLTSTNFLAERVIFFYLSSTITSENVFLAIDGLTKRRLVKISENGETKPVTLVRAGKIYGVTWIKTTNEHQLLQFSD